MTLQEKDKVPLVLEAAGVDLRDNIDRNFLPVLAVNLDTFQPRWTTASWPFFFGKLEG